MDRLSESQELPKLTQDKTIKVSLTSIKNYIC